MTEKRDPIHFFDERGRSSLAYDELLKKHQELQAKYDKLKNAFAAIARQRRATEEIIYVKPTRH